MNNKESRQPSAVVRKGMRIRSLGGLAVLFLAAAVEMGCKEGTKVRECLPVAEYEDLKQNLKKLEGESEYDILGRYGKPKSVSMNTRSEKEYYYRACADSSQERLVLRFTATGRVKEGYIR
jgi:hypothetical protein